MAAGGGLRGYATGRIGVFGPCVERDEEAREDEAREVVRLRAAAGVGDGLPEGETALGGVRVDIVQDWCWKD